MKMVSFFAFFYLFSQKKQKKLAVNEKSCNFAAQSTL